MIYIAIILQNHCMHFTEVLLFFTTFLDLLNSTISLEYVQCHSEILFKKIEVSKKTSWMNNSTKTKWQRLFLNSELHGISLPEKHLFSLLIFKTLKIYFKLISKKLFLTAKKKWMMSVMLDERSTYSGNTSI